MRFLRSRSASPATLFCALALVVVSLAALHASNMIFEVDYDLKAAGAGSLSGTQTLGLPYLARPGITTASDLFQDIGFANVAQIQRFNPDADTFTVYGLNAPDFELDPTRGLFVKMAQDYRYRIVGSHDPTRIVPLRAAGADSQSGSNFISIPYHATARTASELFAELGFEYVSEIQRFNPASDTFTIYGLNEPDFALEVGRAYFVKMVEDLDWVPSHY